MIQHHEKWPLQRTERIGIPLPPKIARKISFKPKNIAYIFIKFSEEEALIQPQRLDKT